MAAKFFRCVSIVRPPPPIGGEEREAVAVS